MLIWSQQHISESELVDWKVSKLHVQLITRLGNSGSSRIFCSSMAERPTEGTPSLSRTCSKRISLRQCHFGYTDGCPFSREHSSTILLSTPDLTWFSPVYQSFGSLCSTGSSIRRLSWNCLHSTTLAWRTSTSKVMCSIEWLNMRSYKVPCSYSCPSISTKRRCITKVVNWIAWNRQVVSSSAVS